MFKKSLFLLLVSSSAYALGCSDNAAKVPDDTCLNDGTSCEVAPACGDSKCDEGETCESCEADCGACEAAPACGDSKCDEGETCENCEADCGACEVGPSCGDSKCDEGETCESCEADCGACEVGPSCGDSKCDEGETCKTCEADCGVCPSCGNGECADDETYASCKQDCMSKHPCANGCPQKMAFLYVGIQSKSGDTYKYYNDLSAQEIDNFGLTDFVISTAYLFRSDDDMDKLIAERLNIIKEYVDKIIHSTNGDKKRVWISLPYVNIPECKAVSNNLSNFYSTLTTDAKDFIDALRKALGDDVWNTYVAGLYMPYESVTTRDCMPFDISNPYANAHLKYFKDISDYIHASKTIDGKKYNATPFLWSPYMVKNDNYWYGPAFKCTFNTALGYVMNKTDIFDLVVIQPGHYFSVYKTEVVNGKERCTQCSDGQSANMHAIKQSMFKQAFVYPEISGCTGNTCSQCTAGAVVGGSKTSKTRIGVQMEIDWEYTSDSVRAPKMQELYQETVDCFNNKTDVISGYDKNNYTISYYLGAKGTTLDKLQQKVREFLEVEPF